MFDECSHSETVRATVGMLRSYGYIVKTEAWASTVLGWKREKGEFTGLQRVEDLYKKLKFNIANMFLGNDSPWIILHTPDFQTRLDAVGIYYKDHADLPFYTFFVKTGCAEIAKRTILLEIEHRHSIEEAVERIKGFPTRKVIIWTRGRIGGSLEAIPIIVSKRVDNKCQIPALHRILKHHVSEITSSHELHYL